MCRTIATQTLELLKESRAFLAELGCETDAAERIAQDAVRAFRTQNMWRRNCGKELLANKAVLRACLVMALREQHALTEHRES